MPDEPRAGGTAACKKDTGKDLQINRMSERKKKRAKTVTLAELVMPEHTNIIGTMYGGDVLRSMDMASSLAAIRFARENVVTASTDAVDFHQPVHKGHIVEINARVVLTGRTSMVIKMEVYGEEPKTGERSHCSTAFFTYVAIDADGRPIEVPELLIETEAEKADAERAQQVRAAARERMEMAKMSPIKRTLDTGAEPDGVE